ncbi:MAG: DNA polymerase III subunit gamma/tau [Candidatus Cloacimonetes bacterium]|jgi:DNA polymerase-3 subunit gamma/tau|nr:DNA polymerase III subunit gamma/tau [Candidatus Cloacimonadota bacterium]
MSYIVLARKYRPQNFVEVYAQDHIVQIIKNAIESDRIGQAYLFTGSRGVGKTTLARLFAKSLNCETGPTINPCGVCPNCVEITQGISADVVEVDGASNTSVDDIRDLQKELMYSTNHSKYKIFIIDEVHMLSKSAFNALLKTLEEPPKNVIFVFATTEPHKILPTIISRCQRFDFKRIPVDAIVARLKEICGYEQIGIDEDALFVIAKKADGGMRDALSLMDQVISYGNKHITSENVRDIFGMVDNDIFHNMMKAISSHNPAQMIFLLNAVTDKGLDINEFINSYLEYLRNILLIQMAIQPKDLNQSQLDLMKEIAKSFSQDEIIYMISYLIDSKNQIRQSHNSNIVIEMCFVKLSRISEMKSINHILEQLESGKVTINQVPAVIQTVQSHQIAEQQTKVIQEKIISDTKDASPLVKELNEDILKEHWDILCEKIAKEYSVTGSFFKNCQIKNFENNGLHLTTSSSIAFTKLHDHKAEIEEIFFKHFNLKIKIFFEMIKAEVIETIKNPSLQDIKNESPNLAKFIEMTDSRII